MDSLIDVWYEWLSSEKAYLLAIYGFIKYFAKVLRKTEELSWNRSSGSCYLNNNSASLKIALNPHGIWPLGISEKGMKDKKIKMATEQPVTWQLFNNGKDQSLEIKP